ncbi:FKBP-type peptidyl-prolyl cis-trans isomerase [Plantibacter flavus]|uniref:FKBP-type peptidyl-prolyl cis-trans isomerase n=1 Tax=Plantibacter flavus TaxID=150123 RepID=UPI003F180EC4
MRTAPALIAAAGLLLVSLTGCTASAAASCEPAAAPGAATKAVSVSGAFGTAPTVDLPTPLYTKTTEREVVIQGDGATVPADGTAIVNWTVFNGRTGEVITQTPYTAGGSSASYLSSPQTLEGFKKTFACATVGSRVVAAISPEDGLAASGGSEAEGIKKDDTLVIVADIEGAALGRADGAEQPIPSGFPSVVTAPNGQPGVTIPSTGAPKTTKHTLSRVGDGATVKEGDQVIVNYTGVLWDGKSVFDSSWDKGEPFVFTAGGGQTIKAFNDAVVGTKVGSQVILVVTPKDGYGDQGTQQVPANSTLVFVIDVLGTVSPPK